MNKFAYDIKYQLKQYILLIYLYQLVNSTFMKIRIVVFLSYFLILMNIFRIRKKLHKLEHNSKNPFTSFF